jgi:D-alanyl-D-alanine carboxypeptidase (penicillin-binding protein 5/6)
MALVLGLAVGVALIVGLQLPLMGRVARASATIRTRESAISPSLPIQWPSVGSAALLIPSIGVRESWHNQVVPIASLTKMMTAYVTLQHLPLAIGQTGPCVSVTTADVATYEMFESEGESVAYVTEGESLCEIDLLNGLLVHSASNYAVMLADLVAGSPSNFIALMNEAATSLGLTQTHYADVSGFDPDSVSTALQQGELAEVLMASPLVRTIVDQTSVTLPVAGTVQSFTPDVGIDNVIGVKSGRTAAAGGCDVMAMTFQQGSTTQTLYAVVLGQQGGDLLGPAGEAALALADSALRSTFPRYPTLVRLVARGTVGWGASRVAFDYRVIFKIRWADLRRVLPVTLHVRRLTGTIRRGETVGWLTVHAPTVRRIALVARSSASPPTLLQRIL